MLCHIGVQVIVLLFNFVSVFFGLVGVVVSIFVFGVVGVVVVAMPG